MKSGIKIGAEYAVWHDIFEDCDMNVFPNKDIKDICIVKVSPEWAKSQSWYNESIGTVEYVARMAVEDICDPDGVYGYNVAYTGEVQRYTIPDRNLRVAYVDCNDMYDAWVDRLVDDITKGHFVNV